MSRHSWIRSMKYPNWSRVLETSEFIATSIMKWSFVSLILPESFYRIKLTIRKRNQNFEEEVCTFIFG